jgi:hypothetical protein
MTKRIPSIKAGVETEIHIFARDTHGLGLGSGDLQRGAWPTLIENWLRQQIFLSPDSSIFPGADIPVARGPGFSVDSRLEQLAVNQRAGGVLEQFLETDLASVFIRVAGSCLRQTSALVGIDNV